MIPSLFFLLLISILGTVVYIYLRQEQDKFAIPKDKYDEAWNEAFSEKDKKQTWNVRLGTFINNVSSSSISLGLGLLSCITLIFYFNDSIMYAFLISGIGSFAAIAGLFIGMFGVFQGRNESSLIRYGGLLLCLAGLMNLISFGGYLLIASFLGWYIP